MPIVHTVGLTRRFNGFVAVDSLDLDVEEGEVFGLLGPNGAGKTTTIKMLTTLLPPSAGVALVDGRDVRSRPSDVRRTIGYVPQMLSADASLTGYENLIIFAKLNNVPRDQVGARAEEALRRMGLSEFGHKLVRTYSGGMVRRLEIAQSTLHHPRVLFLDEPTIGLDPLARRAVWEMVRQLRHDHGTTIFLTTHLMDEADALCDRIAIMHRSKLVVLGHPQGLKEEVGASSLDEVFIHHTGGTIESGGSIKEIQRERMTARRLG